MHRRPIPSRKASAVLVALVLLLSGLLTATTAVVRPTPAAASESTCSYNLYTCWMHRYADLIGQRPLNQVVQPGSHDTGTYNIHNYGSLARNQDADVYTQLARGVRQFDIRVHPRTVNGHYDLYAYHGDIDTDVKLSTMLTDVYRFTTSPGTQQEIIYLDIVQNRTDPQLQAAACSRWQQSMGSIALTRPMIYSAGHMKSMNEIWALPGSPRVIFDWPACQGYSTLWNQDWSGNGDYYANQGNSPCTKYAVMHALHGRWGGSEDRSVARDIPFAYLEGNFCWNFANVPAGSQAMTMLDQHVTGLYTLYIQQTGLVPASATYVQKDVLTMLVDFWNRNVGSARGNLNYVSADYVLDPGTELLTRTISLNTRSDLPRITYRYDTSSADSSKWRYVYTCSSTPDAANTTLTAWTSDESRTTTDAVRITNGSLSLPLTGKYVLRCHDGSSRLARLVQGNQLRVHGMVHQTARASQTQLTYPPTVRLTDAYQRPMSGHYVTFTVTGPGQFTLNGQTTTGSYTDANGLATAPVYLTHANGDIYVTARTALASDPVTTFARVSP